MNMSGENLSNPRTDPGGNLSKCKASMTERSIDYHHTDKIRTEQGRPFLYPRCYTVTSLETHFQKMQLKYKGLKFVQMATF